MISLLLTARKDSKFMAKFIMTFLVNTRDINEIELLIVTPAGDWNKELFTYFKSDKIKIFEDTTDLGRGGSHIFYNMLAKEAKGEWLWYMCDDHYLFNGYDDYIRSYITLNNIDPEKINVIVPQASNSGRISHIISRKYFDTIGVAKHGNVDSYINNTLEYLEVFIGKDEVSKIEHFPPEPIIMDFSVDKEIMKPINSPNFDPVKEAELFKSQETKVKIVEDARSLFEAIKAEHI